MGSGLQSLTADFPSAKQGLARLLHKCSVPSSAAVGFAMG